LQTEGWTWLKRQSLVKPRWRRQQPTADTIHRGTMVDDRRRKWLKLHRKK